MELFLENHSKHSLNGLHIYVVPKGPGFIQSRRRNDHYTDKLDEDKGRVFAFDQENTNEIWLIKSDNIMLYISNKQVLNIVRVN